MRFKRLPIRNRQSTTDLTRFRCRCQILRPFQPTILALVFAPRVFKAHGITSQIWMQSRDPFVIARAAHDAIFEGEGEETHEIHRIRAHIVCVVMNIEGIVSCG